MSASGARILVIEDDPGVRRILARNLGGHGFRVEAAATGREGLERDPSVSAPTWSCSTSACRT